ncbi:hypothetical protein AR543_14060 [Paenibacillus bovis]|uniref:Uncharacterized protein n=1 Tax=Paenibacillus bovis TaxID=1616788 RepID=A0A172ZME7_9BACL|nr:hypothetical protein AR543_14060 [Paenibacillus bovis]
MERSERAFILGKQAIDELKEKKGRISYRNISEVSKKFDSTGKGIHPNSVKSNTKLYDYYKQNCKRHVANKKLNGQFLTELQNRKYHEIKLNRYKTNLQKRYEKYTKSELIELLIHAENHIASQNQMWIKEQFSKFKD